MALGLLFDATFVFYDGECGTCERVVRFLLKRSQAFRFRFVPLEALRRSNLETEIQKTLGLDLQSSLIVWKNGQLYARFAAVLVILSELGFPWYILLFMRIMPLPLSDRLYDLYARNRYRILGRARHRDLCAVVNSHQKMLFPGSWPADKPIFVSRKDVFLSAQWRDLIFVNFAVPADVLRPYVPEGTELDFWQGQSLVSLVAFAFLRTSLGGMTLPMHADFEEINLRFYVKRKIFDGNSYVWRRAVVFLKEIVPHYTLALTARLLYGERYVYEKTASASRHEGNQREITYIWGEGAQCARLTGVMRGESQTWESDSLPAFITEHYFGYVQSRGGATVEYEVEHPSWAMWSPVDVRLEGPWKERYPQEFAPFLTKIHSSLVAEGSVVRVMQGHRLPQPPRA